MLPEIVTRILMVIVVEGIVWIMYHQR